MNSEEWLQDIYTGMTEEERTEYVFISMKIKRFRNINRLFGREVGDELADIVFKILLDWIAQRDQKEYVAHICIDYFNMLLKMPEDYHEKFTVIKELNVLIRDMPDERFHGNIFSGIGIYPIEKGVDFYTAQYNADICRSECPESRYRNTHFEVYGQTFFDTRLQYFDMSQTIKPALDAGHITMYLQPKVNLRTGEVESAEALVRWIDPVRGMIPVGDFLPFLEESGLIEDVDLFLFEHVCRYINRWIEEYGKKISISVNLSADMFKYVYFLAEYQKIHEIYNTPVDCIEFELLESIVLNQVDRVHQVVTELTGYGFRCALDDFGSGFSSYSVLCDPGIQTMKIDRSLFKDEDDVRERTIIKHIIQTAKELGMVTVAEGVETKGYVDYLKELNCDFIQGFVFYKPMPVHEFEEKFVRRQEKIPVK